jgi:hypothetical protein
LTRGDRRRNDRIEALRAIIRPDRAILAIDLGEEKQVAAFMDHDGRVLGRRTVTVKAYALGALLGGRGRRLPDTGSGSWWSAPNRRGIGGGR